MMHLSASEDWISHYKQSDFLLERFPSSGSEETREHITLSFWF